MERLSHYCYLGDHVACPPVIPERAWPDPSRKGTTFTSPERSCSCVCHTRTSLT